MTAADVLELLTRCPLVASVQADEGTPCADPQTLARLAAASKLVGVGLLRLQGVENIRKVRAQTGLPCIGLVKRQVEGSPVYITPTASDALELVDVGCEVIAVDATQRRSPDQNSLKDLVATIHGRGRLVMGDCDSLESAILAERQGVDFIGTTLAGYTEARVATMGPDLELLRAIVGQVSVPVLAEGRFSRQSQVDAALRIGAKGVVVGGVLNDPIKQTRAMMPTRVPPSARVGAVDIGGTWLRFGLFDGNWDLLESEKTPNPRNQQERVSWIQDRVRRHRVDRLGVSTGGLVDPATGLVWAAKEYLMPNHVGIVFDEAHFGVPTFAFGDGHASAWAHANLPRYAGLRLATLALGTGVGCGFIEQGRIWAGSRGEYPRVNDLPAHDGRILEQLLGGHHLQGEPTGEARKEAEQALRIAHQAIRDLYFPDAIVICGSIGMSDWLSPVVEELGIHRSTLGAEAGLYGAAALALFPGWRDLAKP